jgi:hypothetical protein
MRWQALAPVVLALTGVLGCDPVFATQYRQTLHPAPALKCLAGAITALPGAKDLHQLGPHEIGASGPGYRVTLRDSVGIEWPMLVTRQARSDCLARVTVAYVHMGPGPNDAQRRELSELAQKTPGRGSRVVRADFPCQSRMPCHELVLRPGPTRSMSRRRLTIAEAHKGSLRMLAPLAIV